MALDKENEFQLLYFLDLPQIRLLKIYIIIVKSVNHNSLGCKQPYITNRPRCKNGSHPMHMWFSY